MEENEAGTLTNPDPRPNQDDGNDNKEPPPRRRKRRSRSSSPVPRAASPYSTRQRRTVSGGGTDEGREESKDGIDGDETTTTLSEKVTSDDDDDDDDDDDNDSEGNEKEAPSEGTLTPDRAGSKVGKDNAKKDDSDATVTSEEGDKKDGDPRGDESVHSSVDPQESEAQSERTDGHEGDENQTGRDDDGDKDVESQDDKAREINVNTNEAATGDSSSQPNNESDEATKTVPAERNDGHSSQESPEETKAMDDVEEKVETKESSIAMPEASKDEEKETPEEEKEVSSSPPMDDDKDNNSKSDPSSTPTPSRTASAPKTPTSPKSSSSASDKSEKPVQTAAVTTEADASATPGLVADEPVSASASSPSSSLAPAPVSSSTSRLSPSGVDEARASDPTPSSSPNSPLEAGISKRKDEASIDMAVSNRNDEAPEKMEGDAYEERPSGSEPSVESSADKPKEPAKGNNPGVTEGKEEVDTESAIANAATKGQSSAASPEATTLSQPISSEKTAATTQSTETPKPSDDDSATSSVPMVLNGVHQHPKAQSPSPKQPASEGDNVSQETNPQEQQDTAGDPEEVKSAVIATTGSKETGGTISVPPIDAKTGADDDDLPEEKKPKKEDLDESATNNDGTAPIDTSGAKPTHSDAMPVEEQTETPPEATQASVPTQSLVNIDLDIHKIGTATETGISSPPLPAHSTDMDLDDGSFVAPHNAAEPDNDVASSPFQPKNDENDTMEGMSVSTPQHSKVTAEYHSETVPKEDPQTVLLLQPAPYSKRIVNAKDVSILKMRLYAAAIKAHRVGDRLFAQYWQSLSHYMSAMLGECFQKSLLVDSKKVISDFLVNKRLRKLHNQLVLGKFVACCPVSSLISFPPSRVLSFDV